MFVDIHRLVENLPEFTNPRIIKEQLPPNGLYLFHEHGESFKDYSDGSQQKRIVRIGTSTREGRFPGRMIAHYRKAGSIFHRHLDSALGTRYERENHSSWGHVTPDDRMTQVLEYLEKRFTFRIISFPTAEEACTWEKKLIATLAPYSFQVAGKN